MELKTNTPTNTPVKTQRRKHHHHHKRVIVKAIAEQCANIVDGFLQSKHEGHLYKQACRDILNAIRTQYGL